MDLVHSFDPQLQVIFVYFLASILVPDYVSDSRVPRWLHALCAVAVFMYMHLVSGYPTVPPRAPPALIQAQEQ
jgi:hypothetical protein